MRKEGGNRVGMHYQMKTKFKENLPANCPPGNAGPLKQQLLIRLVGSNQPSDEDFKSHGALGKKCPKFVCQCEWTSCSLWNSAQNVLALPALPKLRKRLTHVAYLQVDEASGMAHLTPRTGHVSLWMAAAYDPVAAISKTEPLP